MAETITDAERSFAADALRELRARLRARTIVRTDAFGEVHELVELVDVEDLVAEAIASLEVGR